MAPACDKAVTKKPSILCSPRSRDALPSRIPNKEVAAKAALDTKYLQDGKLRSNVELGNLKGKIRARVHKLWYHQEDRPFRLDTRDDEFRFRMSKSPQQKQCSTIFARDWRAFSDVKLGKHGGKDNIGVRVGKVINKYKVAKHFVLQSRDDGFDFHIDERWLPRQRSMASMSSGPACPNSAYHPTTPSAATRV